MAHLLKRTPCVTGIEKITCFDQLTRRQCLVKENHTVLDATVIRYQDRKNTILGKLEELNLTEFCLVGSGLHDHPGILGDVRQQL